MNSWLKKKLSIGISFGLISTDEIILLLDMYSDYIHDIYFSPTESIRLQTRLNIYDFNTTTNEMRLNELDQVIKFAKSKGIKISLVLNTLMVQPIDMVSLYTTYNNRYSLDYVTTTSLIADLIKKENPNQKIVCSYNEGILSIHQLKEIIKKRLFDSIVLGNSFIRNFEAFSLIKKCDLSTILLVNNGCSFGCSNFCHANNNDYCKNLFYKRLEETDSVSYLYALQSLFPEELESHYKDKPFIDIFKLSSRPISYVEYSNLLESYVTSDSKSYIEKSSGNYHLYARLAHFKKYYNTFDYDRIINKKNKIWLSSRDTSIT